MDATRIGTMKPDLILTRAGDKFLSLKAGEVIRAQVVSILADGNLSLRIKGNLIEARSDIQLQQGSNVLVRVLGQAGGHKSQEIRLQLLEATINSEAARLPQEPAATEVQTLARELAANVSAMGRAQNELAVTVERLIKALPDNTATLPRELRLQLQDLLQTTLGYTGKSIQNRVTALFNEPILAKMPELIDLLGVKDRLLADMEGFFEVPLKSILDNTGVALEAKLRALAALLPEQGEVTLNDPSRSPAASEQPFMCPIEEDLKARLLQIRQRVMDLETQASRDTTSYQTLIGKEPGETKEAMGRVLENVNGLLREIETFQALSKLTHSFYTFLPVIWKGLREGEIAFKRSRSGPQGKSYYCLMNLNFEELGKLTVVAMMQDRDIFVSFKTENSGFRAVLDDNIHELKQMIRAQGFHLKAVNFLGKQEDHLAPFEHLESFEHIINVRI